MRLASLSPLTLPAFGLLASACGGTTAALETDAGPDAVPTHQDSAVPVRDSGVTSADAHPEVRDAGAPDACITIPADADIQCGKSCAYPGYTAPCPSEPGTPFGISCSDEASDSGPVWFCSGG